MKTWNIDADTVTIDDDWASIVIVENSSVKDFLTLSDHDKKFFVVAPKGYGKTLLLKKKSSLYRTKKSSNVFIPKNNLCEKLSQQNLSFSVEDLNSFQEINHWVDLWKLSLSIFILHNFNIILSDKINKIIGQASRLSDILNAFLLERSRLYDYKKLLVTEINPKLDEIQEDVAIFIDNIDEAFDNYVGYNLLEGNINTHLEEKVWINAQLGFIYAVIQINQMNPNTKIFASIRHEAFNMNKNATALQVKSYCTELSYTYPELKTIFEENIIRMSKDNLVMPAGNTPLEKFLGFFEIEHRFAINCDGMKIKEDPFDYIYRHTFRRPRELVYMGHQLAKLPPQERQNIKNFRNLVNISGLELLNQYKKEFIPYFDDYKFDLFLKHIKSNVICRKEAEIIFNRLKDQFGHIFSYFYNCGLIGYVDGNNGNPSKQRFSHVAQGIFKTGDSIPNSAFYVLHPSVNDYAITFHRDFKWDFTNIVGYNYQFVPCDEVNTLTHVHFGAGKLGLGLVVPLLLLNKNVSLAIVQRDSPKWEKLSKNEEEIIITTDGYPPYKFLLMTDTMSDKTKKKLISKWQDGQNMLILTNNQNTIKTILKSTTSVSTALGFGLRDITDHLRHADVRNSVPVLPFENDAKMVEDFTAELSGLNSKFEVTSVIADRICKEVEINGSIIKVHSEKQFLGSAVVLNEKLSDNSKDILESLFTGSQQVTIVTSSDLYSFYYKKKFFLVNGIHMITAILGYYRLHELNLLKSKQDIPITFIIEHRELYKQIKTFCNLEVLRLILQTNDTLPQVYEEKPISVIFNELQDNAEGYLKRFVVSGDALNRILDLNKSLMDKYCQRVEALVEFVRDNEKEIKNLKLKQVPSITRIYKEFNDLNRKLNRILIEESDRVKFKTK